MLKPLFLGLLFFVITLSTQSQWGAHVAQLRPLGEMGMIFKKQFSPGISYQNAFEDGKRWGADFTYFRLRSRLEEFPIVGTIGGGNGTFVSLGTQTFSNYTLLMLDAYYDWAIWDKEVFQFYGGGGITMGASAVEYETSSPGISSESYSGGGTMGGLFLRMGFDYQLGDSFTLGLAGFRRIYFHEEAGIFGDYVLRLAGIYHF